MMRTLTNLAAGLSLFAGLAVPAQAAEVSVARLDCGTPQAPTAVNQRFSDTWAYGELKLQLVYSCTSSNMATTICCGIPAMP
jgi:N-acyl homoserine lactone hydrolase